MKLSSDQKNFLKWVGIFAPIYMVFYQMAHWLRNRSFAWRDLLVQMLLALALIVLGLLFFALWDDFTGKKNK